MSYGVLSLLPPVVALLLCFLTKEVISSLFIGVLVGGLLVGKGNIFAAIASSWDWSSNQLLDKWQAEYFLFLFVIGGAIGLMYKLGGGVALVQKLEKKVENSKKSQVLIGLLGILVFFNEYANTAIVGTASKSLSDKNRISREKFSYLLDSTSSPVSGLAPISDWAGYQTNTIAVALAAFGSLGVSAYTIWLRSLPYMFYCWFAIALVFIIALTEFDYGPMKKAECRARNEGKVLADDAIPAGNIEAEVGEVSSKHLSIWTFIVPVVALVGVALYGMWYTGGGTSAGSFADALGNSDTAAALLWGAFAMTIACITFGLVWKIMTFKEMMETFIQGAKTMFIAFLLMVFAWALKAACDAVGTADYTVNLVLPLVQNAPAILPVVVFLVCMLLSFGLGTSWGTMAIISPIALPLVLNVNNMELNSLVYATIGAVLSGSIFGDHCSPISDTTIVSSTFAGSDHMAHVTTQIPYAFTAAGISIIGYLLMMISIPWFIILPVGVVLLYFAVVFFSKRSAKKYNLPQATPVYFAK
ncbi:Na+/H+ antiporter NhaC family protein [uncultured Sphaerochaeta sp.]|uniref:Na+/H+ antiporter NhaC family protein n=1 Tax=uncultured Sphaerochaeta sp. TaxID=886478 RepID=UPI002A0A18F1|nr:Na+/H+ antiporter NhaC family protein [uncultured Sphaerochaeta sp.]